MTSSKVSPTTAHFIIVPLTSFILATLSGTSHYLPISFPPSPPPPSLSSPPLNVLYYALHPLLSQLAPTAPINLLLIGIIAHRIRDLSRLWGTRKWLSYLVTIWLITAIAFGSLQLASLTAQVLFRKPHPRERGSLESILTIPSGPLTILFSLLPVWSTTIPPLWRWDVIFHLPVLVSAQNPPTPKPTLTVRLSSHTTSHLLALHLSLTHFPASLLPALLGYAFGTAWTWGLMPTRVVRWRVPAWVVGDTDFKSEKRNERNGPGLGSSTSEFKADADGGKSQETERSREGKGKAVRRRGP